jgi:hypothetical protein
VTDVLTDALIGALLGAAAGVALTALVLLIAMWVFRLQAAHYGRLLARRRRARRDSWTGLTSDEVTR